MVLRSPLVIGTNGKPQQIQSIDTLGVLDSVWLIQNSSDVTKQLMWNLGTISTATTRTLTIPNASGTIVLEDNTATITNKSIVATQLTGTLQAAQFPILSGDISTTGGSLSTTIGANVVTNAKAAQMAAGTIKGNNTGGTANALDLTTTQITAMINTVSSSLSGAAPASGGGTTSFLRADITWATLGTGTLANSVAVAVAFGASYTDKAQTVVTGQSWVTSTSIIAATILTPSGVDPDEMYLLNIRPVISNLIVGTGFTVTLYSEPEAVGTYTVNCIGV